MAEFVFNQAGLIELLHGPHGAVGRDLARRAIAVESRAKQNASGRPGPNVITGRLRSSITWQIGADAIGLFADVGSNVEYACLFGANTAVMTDRGPRTIGQIRPGERVFTQAGEFHAVTAKTSFPAREKPELREIAVPWRKGADHRLTLTLDHKVLCFREGRNQWIHAGNLVDGDLLYTRAKVAHNRGTGAIKVCEWCDRRHQRQGRRYCSPRCRNLAWASGLNPHLGMRRSEATRKKLREHAIRRGAGQQMNRILAQRGHITSCEAEVERWLLARGVPYERQMSIGQHVVDFYLPDSGEVLEADGAYWHRDQPRDVERDRELLATQPGIEITHIHFFDPRFSPPLDGEPLPGVRYVSCNPGPASFTDPVHLRRMPVTIMRDYTYGREKRPHDALKAKLYDLSVENVHSFLVAGVIVSNSYVELGTDRAPAYPFLRPALIAASL